MDLWLLDGLCTGLRGFGARCGGNQFESPLSTLLAER